MRSAFREAKWVVFTGMLQLLYQREAEYRQRMADKGQQPLSSLQAELEAAAKAEEARRSHASANGGMLHRLRQSWRQQEHQSAAAEEREHTMRLAIAEGRAHAPADQWAWPEHPPQAQSSAQSEGSEGWQWLRRTVRDWLAGDEYGTLSSSGSNSIDQVHNDAELEAVESDPGKIASLSPLGTDAAATDAAAGRVHSHSLDAAGLVVDRGLLANHLAHEVAHALARHSAEQLSRTLPLSLLRTVTSASRLLAPALDYLYALPYSRLHEREADRLGLTLMSRACFHPAAAHSFWTSFQGTPPQRHYFSTHPADERRAEDAAVWYGEAKQAMKRCCRGKDSQRRQQAAEWRK